MDPNIMPHLSFSEGERERRGDQKEDVRDLWRKFTQEPIPLPTWMWNSIVILLNLVVALLVLWAGVALVAVVLGVVFGI